MRTLVGSLSLKERYLHWVHGSENFSTSIFQGIIHFENCYGIFHGGIQCGIIVTSYGTQGSVPCDVLLWSAVVLNSVAKNLKI